MFTKTSLEVRLLIAKILNYKHTKIFFNYKFYIVLLNLIIHCKLYITQKLIFLIFGKKSKNVSMSVSYLCSGSKSESDSELE